jgi:hypothetical protein
MSHTVTAQDLFFEMKQMPPAERVKFFALLSENAFRHDDFSHGQVFGHLEGETLSAADFGANTVLSFAPRGLRQRANPGSPWRRSPLMDVIRDLAMEMRGYESEMGFTPAARSRVQVPQDSVYRNDPWSEIAG